MFAEYFFFILIFVFSCRESAEKMPRNTSLTVILLRAKWNFPSFNPRLLVMVPFFNRTRLERIGDRWAGDWAAAGLVCRLRMPHRWFVVSGCGTPLQRQEKERAGGGFARSCSDA